ncbi:late competence development ComFB family protein [Caldicellulosiruptor morganii]|uniref:Competence protein ComFB n=1 Tax=Caldicellulosiruptor morganii TaxID=1387555 RepID=A0ABY7BK65_9FIRM|nr:competence protein ComFB [Caldicellulosiruptor morganii]WAM33199.1 competence protein ComFB [Caldicellulosiruptor morganii]
MKYKVKNAMEEIVEKYYDVVIEDFKDAVCTCEKCRADVIALALNRLPPRYYVTEEGKIYSMLKSMESQFRVDVIAALAAAMFIVKNNQKHDKEFRDK